MNPCDIIGRELNIGDVVVFTNNIYEVLSLGKANPKYGYARIMLVEPSKTTRPQNKYSREMCLLPKEDFLKFIES